MRTRSKPAPAALANQTRCILEGTSTWTGGLPPGAAQPSCSSFVFPWGEKTTYELGASSTFQTSSQEGEGGTITDDPNAALNTAYKSCEHIKESFSFPSSGVTKYELTHSGSNTGSNYRIDMNLTCYHSAESRLVDTYISSALNKFESDADTEHNQIDRAWGHVSITTPTSGFNLPQFVGELRDFKDIFGSISNRFSKLVKSPEKMRELGRVGRHLQHRGKTPLTIQNYLDTAVKLDLGIQFILKPLLSDLKSMNQFQKHLDRLIVKRNIGQPIVAHGTSSETLEYEWHYPNNSWSTTWSRRDITVQVTRTITATYAYQHRKGDQLTSQTARLEALGFNRPLSVAFELMRWSFLIDYFLSVGDSVAQLEQQVLNMMEDVEELYSGTSIKTTASLGVSAQFKNAPWLNNLVTAGPTGPGALGYATHSTYSRDPGVSRLGVISKPVFKLPNIRQALNLADIAILRSLR